MNLRLETKAPYYGELLFNKKFVDNVRYLPTLHKLYYF